MGNMRHNAHTLSSTSNSQRNLREIGVTSVGAPASLSDSVRNMEPFFPNEEEVYDTLVEDNRSLTCKSQSGGKPRRGHYFSTKCSREVGVSTLPIGQFPSTLKDAEPISFQPVPMKGVYTALQEDEEAQSMCDNAPKIGHRINQCNGTNIDKRNPHRARSTSMAPFFNSENGELSNCVEETVLKSFNNANSRMSKCPYQPAPISTEIPGRVLNAADKGPPPTQLVNNVSDVTASAHLKSLLREKGIIPSITEDASRRPYAFSKHFNSPDPSSIPIPGLR
ncbi:hypothetical protein X943_000915 [Babesia divergens]|uniref:Uncharacterized protein n=1 Tax=Babesia divergens TaxID=32595 RepID=A0AAD9LDQ7_BABDI|nr:hypothetical protein X943_000915 [Babesia divergens]